MTLSYFFVVVEISKQFTYNLVKLFFMGCSKSQFPDGCINVIIESMV